MGPAAPFINYMIPATLLAVDEYLHTRNDEFRSAGVVNPITLAKPRIRGFQRWEKEKISNKNISTTIATFFMRFSLR